MQKNIPVSYTHLDVYKRQQKEWLKETLEQYYNPQKYNVETATEETAKPTLIALFDELDVYKRQALASRPTITTSRATVPTGSIRLTTGATRTTSARSTV